MLEIGKLDPIAPPDIPGYVAGLAPRAVAAEVSAGMAQNALSQVMGIASQGGDPAAALAAIAQMVQATMEQIPEEAEKAAGKTLNRSEKRKAARKNRKKK